jgi:UDP-glucose 4-epimerase
VSDLAEAHVLALGALDQGSRVYNLGNGQGFSVLEVVESARRITGHPIPVDFAPRRDGDVARLVADSARIRKELGWTPRIPELDRIIEKRVAVASRPPERLRTIAGCKPSSVQPQKRGAELSAACSPTGGPASG